MCMESQLRTPNIIKALKQHLIVKSVFHRHIVTEPAILYKVLRDYLVLNDFKYVLHPKDNKISYGLAKCFFANAQDKQFAAIALQEKIKIDVSESTFMHSKTQNYNNYVDEVKTKQNFSQNFKQDPLYNRRILLRMFFINYETSAYD